MKKWIVFLLCAAILLSVTGCASGSTSETAATETEAPLTEAVPETTAPVETEPVLTGDLYLSVSEITFSLVGESEDIYIGTAPREQITWEIADESVATFADGVLTATGVGSTTASARHGDHEITVKVGCLAQTQEELEALDEEVLRSPKRMPPVITDPPYEFFDDAAIIGDSISYILFQYETKLGHLGNPLFLARGGTSLNGLCLYYKNVYYRGVETKIEKAVAASGVTKVFVNLGQNDLGFRTIESTMSSWDLLIGRIHELNPDVEIYIQSAFPIWRDIDLDNEKNEKISQYNEELIRYCEENGHHYVDVAKYVVDHTDRLATIYSMDRKIHLNETGCIAWMQALNAYVEQMLLGGTGL